MSVEILSLIAAIVISIILPVMGYIKIGIPPVIIVGGSALVGLLLWYKTYLYHPTDPDTIVPLFILTVAALQTHIVEEYLTGFGPAMSRVFGIHWTERSFLLIFALVGPLIYTLTILGLLHQIPIAGFVAWFIFIGPGVAEFTHFIFPFKKPAIQPENPAVISGVVRGGQVDDMPNYYYKTSGKYYFAGMWTAALPMIPGIYAIVTLV